MEEEASVVHSNNRTGLGAGGVGAGGVSQGALDDEGVEGVAGDLRRSMSVPGPPAGVFADRV